MEESVYLRNQIKIFLQKKINVSLDEDEKKMKHVIIIIFFRV